MIELGTRPLTLADVVRVARGPQGEQGANGPPPRPGVPIEIKLSARRGRACARAAPWSKRAVQDGRVIYGVTTGFGELKDRRIAPDQVRALQLNLLRSHCRRRRSRAPRATWCARCCCCARLRWRAGTPAVASRSSRRCSRCSSATSRRWSRSKGSVGASGDLGAARAPGGWC